MHYRLRFPISTLKVNVIHMLTFNSRRNEAICFEVHATPSSGTVAYLEVEYVEGKDDNYNR